MSNSETTHVTHAPYDILQDSEPGLQSYFSVYGGYHELLQDQNVLTALSEAYVNAFRREPWNESYTFNDVASKLERQLTIPGTRPLIVALENGERFGFAWGCDGPMDVIIPKAVENDFPDMPDDTKESVISSLLGQGALFTEDRQVFWGCELGVNPPGGNLFLRLVREEARRANSQTLFGMTKEGTSFLSLMRSRGGLSEVRDGALPEGCRYFFQDLGKLVKREGKK